uniref:clathrin light chain B isoform X3 n=1 Tax=Euleptes europaea TaxID=460621 RepID=UPI0025414E16|nr:clathrin light chain B isoform X3 [Euleptes europaea]
MADDFGFFSSSESGAAEAPEEDPAAAFLAQQESEIAGIENDEGFGAAEGGCGEPQGPGNPRPGGPDASSKVLEQEWREKAKKDLEEWNLRQNEQMERNRVNNRASEEAFLKESKEETPGTEWEKVAQLCDFNPKSSKQSKDVSRMRSVLISLKQTPLAR